LPKPLPISEKSTYGRKDTDQNPFSFGNWRGAIAAAPHLSYDGKSTMEQKKLRTSLPSLLKTCTGHLQLLLTCPAMERAF
jgi:hypothetical protein